MATDSIEFPTSQREFMVKVGHELRTPIYGILGTTELALDEDLPLRARDYLQTAKDSAETLLQLVNEILDFFEIESGKLESDLAGFRLRSLINEVVDACSTTAREKGLKLDCEVAAPDNLIGNAFRLRHVLTNLLNNAVKFTDQGRVGLRALAETESPTEVQLRFEVFDTGIGISGDDQRRVFTAFTQVDSSRTRRHGGTGLGLTTAAEWVRTMGGRLGIQSTLGQGSTFYFKLALPRGPDAQVETQANSAPVSDLHGPHALAAKDNTRSHPMRVLLAEDTVASQKIVKGILNKRGHAVEIARNGREAVEMFRLQPYDYDIVLMDVQMPIMDGLQAAASIRAFEAELGRRVPIVAMTAHVMPGDRRRCLAAGMDAYLGKPVKTAKLIEIVEALSVHFDRGNSFTRMKPSCVECHPSLPGDPSVFDAQATLKRLGNDRQLFADLLEFFLEDYPILVDRVRQGLHDRDLAEVALAAHSLKGLAANFDALQVVVAAAAIEKAGHDGDFEAATQSLDALEREISRLRDALLEYRNQL
jgi:CheY-like chemotaxis protein